MINPNTGQHNRGGPTRFKIRRISASASKPTYAVFSLPRPTSIIHLLPQLDQLPRKLLKTRKILNLLTIPHPDTPDSMTQATFAEMFDNHGLFQ